MKLYLKETEDTENDELVYELQDEEGNTIVNLSNIVDGRLSDVEKYKDHYYVGSICGEDDYECSVIFDTKGAIIISHILSYKYIEVRNEFIVYVNGANNDECYNETFKYDEEYCGVIDYFGDFILPPNYDKIEYIEEFDLYKVNNKEYYLDGEYIGSESESEIYIYNCLLFDKNNKIGLLNNEGIILDAQYTVIDQPYENENFFVISDGIKYGIYNIKLGKQPELKFDEISVSFYHEFNGEYYYKVRIGNRFGLVNTQMELLFDNLLEGIDEDSFTNHTYVNEEGKALNYSTFIALEKGKFWHGEINENVSTTRKCLLNDYSMFSVGYDYLKLFYYSNINSEPNNIFITVGYKILSYNRNYLLLINNKNKGFTTYELGLNDELLITCIDNNKYGALVINSSCQTENSKNEIVIPFIYESLSVNVSKFKIITGIIGKANNTFYVFEPIKFNKIGNADSHENALKILSEYYL